MCGINGILYFNSYCRDKPSQFFENNIQRMNEEIRHRGPDGEGIMTNYPVCFGHLRLSIIDLSENGSQPMFSEDRSLAIIYNGEIYNYLELIPELRSKGHIFRSKSDTEVILNAYKEYGYDCVNKFNGMWAFAIYDFRKKTLFISRDRLGVKPFYYYKDDEQFIFSSEIKAILKIKKITEANHTKVFEYLAYGYKTSNGETFFKDIHELKGGHNIIIENDSMEIKQFWDFGIDKKTDENNHEKINSLLYDSVRLRFRSDVPVAILLSGGLDSSIIAKITDELIDKGELESATVTAFTAVFPGFIFDESAVVEEFLKTCRHIKQIRISPAGDELVDKVNEFVYGMGEPVFSTTSFAHYMLMQEIKMQNVKVVMNGQGSDEVWAGYDRYIIGYYLLDLLYSSPQNFISQIRAMSVKMQFSYKYILLQTLKSMMSRKSASYLRSSKREKVFDVLDKNFTKNNYDKFVNPGYNKFSSSNLSGYLKYNIQYQGFNQILHYEDHSSMQSSIEMRSPFIDYRLVEAAFTMENKYKIDSGVTKKILRELFKDKLPDSIIKNYKKIGFVTPFDDWMKNAKPKAMVMDLISSDSFRQKSVFDPAKVADVFTKNENRNFPYWRFINLEIWSEMYNISNL
ncbi:MAG: asparagine synthase (glutamine-hydrolyzing) [bacterium]